MVQQVTYLIVGNGIAGITAAEVLRTEDAEASIGIVAQESVPVYYRPALKDYLTGKVSEEKLWARPTKFYQQQKIMFLPEQVTRIHATEHAVQLQNKKTVRYQKLLLASGARPARLTCPGMDLQGVLTLRSVTDYQELLDRLEKVRNVVVCGGGTLAIETIEALRQRRLTVTHIIRGRTLWSDVLDETASELILQQEQHDGVIVHLQEEIVAINGERGRVKEVVTSNGEHIACELVLIAIGIEPNIDFIRASNIACWRGVRVDQNMLTSARDVYAAGDVVEITDAMAGRTRVLGQWYPAIQQARIAVYNMLNILDSTRSFNSNTFYNATCLYGLDFAAVGITNAQQYQTIVADPKPHNYRKVLLKDGIPVGMLALGDRQQVLAFKRAIDHHVNLLPVLTRLFAADFQLSAWLDMQGVPPVVLGASRSSAEVETVIRPIIYSDEFASSDTHAKMEKVAEGSMFTSQPLSEPTEALLVQISAPTQHLPETVLSRDVITIIGRQAGVHLLIDEGSVSRHHAEITYSNGHYLLRDAGSSNGTFVNNIRLPVKNLHMLEQNDEVRFGNIIKFRFFLRTLTPMGQGRALRVNVSAEETTKRDYPLVALPQQSQPILNPDGSLLAPGAAQPVPAAVVNTFKEAPALIVLPEGSASRVPQVHLLTAQKNLSLGRERGNDIELADAVVSRRHAEIVSRGVDYYIHDLGSSNGITFNQQKLPKNGFQRLAHGDQLIMGSTIVLFVDLQAGREQTEKVPSLEPPTIRTSLVPNQIAASPEISSRQAIAQSQPVISATNKPFFAQTSTPQSQIVICQHCGVANMRVARFCAGCSTLL